MCICTPPVNYCNHCGNNVDCCKVSTHFPSMTSLLISTPTSLECHSVIQPISPMKTFWYLTISPYRPVISQGDNLGELQGPLWQGKARQGGMLVANIKTFWSRVTFADCCQHPPAFLLQRIRVVSQPVGGRCVRKKLARRRKSLWWGRSRWGKETKFQKENPLHTLPAAAGQALPQEGIRLKDAAAACFDICFTTDMLEKKRLCTELHSWPAHHCNEHHKQGNSCPTAILFCLILSPQPLINCSICFWSSPKAKQGERGLPEGEGEAVCPD